MQKKYTVGTVRGFFSEKILLDAGLKPGINIEQVAMPVQNVRKLFRNRVDMVNFEDLTFVYYLKATNNKVSETEKVLDIDYTGNLCYAFNKETEKTIVEKFQKAFEKIRSGGVYDAIKKGYLR